ncbi:MAG: tRNA threonylcarbamoyladenosine dehydratase [Clostridiales bacterium]|jgi:tRNA A37 threonylcarbamoyladenosine dehydratase|nr:tRNA threonylcarbamoyladenosine dehydratase [Clostridiales bacterium]
MINEFSRTELIIGEQNQKLLFGKHVAVFGLGGVGSYVVEALCRSGVGHFTLVDNDAISITNLNRQLIATHKTLGMMKTEVIKQRVIDINPKAVADIYNIFYTGASKDLFNYLDFDYMVDAIDTVSSKIMLAQISQDLNVPLISCMGTGNKLDPTKLVACDIFETSACPLAKVMRKELRARGIKKLKVVYSTEPPITPGATDEITTNKKRCIIGSSPFVPPAAGILIASQVVKGLIDGADKA